jgi:pimeloyl-ACP methyl ester carboxylesterase
MNQIIELSDGRKFEWLDNGVSSEEALIFHNGTTCGLDVWNVWLEKAAQRGVRAISLNRPGIGSSTRNAGRRMHNDVDDIRALVTQLGIKKFVSIGWSGGGGRALGSSFIETCVGVHTIAGIPYQDPNDSRWMAVVSPERHEKGQINRADFDVLLKNRSATFEEDKHTTTEMMLTFFEQDLPRFEEFKAEYESFAKDFADSIRVALVNGPEADADDYAANLHLWGFNIDDITKPVTIWHGELDDDVEIQYGEYNHSRIAGSTFIRLEGIGHIDIMVEARDRILAAAVGALYS